MNEDDSFLTLLKRMRAGDASASDIFWQKLGPELSRTAKSLAPRFKGVKLETEDVAHEVAILIHHYFREGSRYPRFDNDEQFRNWLIHITRRVVSNLLRRDYRQNQTLPRNLDVATDGLPDDSQIDSREQLAWVLSQVPPRERTAVELYLAGSGTVEAAKVMGISDKGFRGILNRALQTIRQLLESRSKPKPSTRPSVAIEVVPKPASVETAGDDPQGAVANEPFIFPRSAVDPLVELYFAGNNLSSKEIRLFLDYIAARYRELGGAGLTVVEGQTLVPESVGVTT